MEQSNVLTETTLCSLCHQTTPELIPRPSGGLAHTTGLSDSTIFQSSLLPICSLIVCRRIVEYCCKVILYIHILAKESILTVDIVKVFGTNLRKYRHKLGVSQEKFAEMCGLHRTYISDIERFQRSIALENVQKIADALGIETYRLFLEDKNNVQ